MSYERTKETNCLDLFHCVDEILTHGMNNIDEMGRYVEVGMPKLWS